MPYKEYILPETNWDKRGWFIWFNWIGFRFVYFFFFRKIELIRVQGLELLNSFFSSSSSSLCTLNRCANTFT